MKKTLLFFFMLAALCMQARNREVHLRLIATAISTAIICLSTISVGSREEAA